MLIIPCNSNDKDGVRWVKNIRDPKPRKFECKLFTNTVFEMWGWERDQAYRAAGQIMLSGKQVVMVFDFSNAETWINRKSGSKEV